MRRLIIDRLFIAATEKGSSRQWQSVFVRACMLTLDIVFAAVLFVLAFHKLTLLLAFNGVGRLTVWVAKCSLNAMGNQLGSDSDQSGEDSSGTVHLSTPIDVSSRRNIPARSRPRHSRHSYERSYKSRVQLVPTSGSPKPVSSSLPNMPFERHLVSFHLSVSSTLCGMMQFSLINLWSCFYLCQG